MTPNLTSRFTRRAGLAAALALLLPIVPLSQAKAQAPAYPSKTIRFVVPFAAGSATDTLARVLGQTMSQSLGQAIVVENMPGATGQIAASNVARSAPDGYTVLVTSNSTHASNQSLYKKLSYDHVKDFEPVTTLGTITLALVVN
ncbi:MAG: ABC transporter substrate-binding protein, partial [Rhizobiales bacterium 32-66-11]